MVPSAGSADRPSFAREKVEPGRVLPSRPGSGARVRCHPPGGLERAAAGRHADDAVVDLEYAGAGVRDLFGPRPHLSAASGSG